MNIHVYPGMGATKEMYSGEWIDQPFLFHNWPEYKGEASIEDLAQRLIMKHDIQENDSLIGSSLGGMIACEISNQIKIKKLILIGSATNSEEIRNYLELIHPLIDYTPISFIQHLSGKVGGELNQMFKNANPEFIRNMSKAIFSWKGLKSNSKLVRIHGKNDLVIRCPTSNCEVLNGGHLIATTHSSECVNIIQKKALL